MTARHLLTRQADNLVEAFSFMGTSWFYKSEESVKNTFCSFV